MKIYDCFQFFDENMMLDLRLNILDKHVHKFVIVENLFLHSGQKKRQNFDIKNFKKFKDKIIYILVDELPDGLYDIEKQKEKDKANRTIDNTLKIEHNQRNKISEGLKGADETDLIIVSDVDEIPKLSFLKSDEIQNNILIFEQKMFYYKLNLFYSDFKWFGTKGVKRKNFLSPQWLRNIKGKKYKWWRLDTLFSRKKYSNLIYVKNGGWHFTCLRSPEELEKKLLNFAHHYEYEESGLKIEDLKKLINEKRVMYDHNIDQKGYKWSGSSTLKKVDFSILPEYVSTNSKKFESWLD